MKEEEENKRNTAKEKKKRNKGYPYKQLNIRDKESAGVRRYT